MANSGAASIAASIIGAFTGGLIGIVLGYLVAPRMSGWHVPNRDPLFAIATGLVNIFVSLVGAALCGVFGAVSGAAIGAAMCSDITNDDLQSNAEMYDRAKASELAAENRRLQDRIKQLETTQLPSQSSDVDNDSE